MLKPKPKNDFCYPLKRNERLTFDKILNKLYEFASHFRLTTVHIEYDSLLSLIERWIATWCNVIARQVIATNQIRKQFELK